MVSQSEKNTWCICFRNLNINMFLIVSLSLKQKISRTATIDDECGKPMLGLTILSMIIRYLKGDLFKRMEQRGMPLRDQDILWVLTVPAIWSDAAKQFTKEAAEEVYVYVVIIVELEYIFKSNE